jgi:hypothetical protein
VTPIERVKPRLFMKLYARTLGTITLCLILTGCSGSSSPTSATADNLSGTWVGSGTPQRCVQGGRELNCWGQASLPVRAGLRLTLRPRRGTPAGFDGELGFYGGPFPVSGSVDADGVLSLTGQGWFGNTGTRVILTEWRTREAGGVMTGTATMDLDNAAVPVFTITWALDTVVKE